MQITPLSPEISPAAEIPKAQAREAELRASAQAFEATFIAQMLQHAGLDEAFGAEEGLATESLSGLVIKKIAEDIAKNGGFGLADRFYTALAAKESDSITDFRA